MGARTWTLLLAATLAAAAFPLDEASAAQRGRGRTPEIWQAAPVGDDYGRGYREGVVSGEGDARSGRSFNPASSAARTRYGVGFSDGYRTGYDRQHALAPLRPRVDSRLASQRSTRTHPEPAFAAGYEDGFAKGVSDGRDGHRYDPVRHAEYRDAERGYRTTYGSREAYQTNYRAGFRQGYEDGYRLGARNRR